MKPIEWNIEGLGIPKKNSSIKEVLKKQKADVVILQETKKPSINKRLFQSVWGGRNREWVFTPSEDAAGGMLIAWTSDYYSLLAVKYSIYTYQSNCQIATQGLQGGSLVFMAHRLIEARMSSGLNYMTLVI